MKINLSITVFLILTISNTTFSQLKENLSRKVTLSVNANIETYFFAEKLAVEHIDNYVFSNKNTDYTHQPIVYFGLKEFMPWKDSPVILKISEILRQLREINHDNQDQIIFLLYKKQFPQMGFRWSVPQDFLTTAEQRNPGTTKLFFELSDSLASFYKQAAIKKFIKQNISFYKGALAEAKTHINVKKIPYMEKWYGQEFAGYQIYLMPGMPIPPGEDNYRAFGPKMTSPKGEVATMVFSTSIQLPLLSSLKEYKNFGFNNEDVINLLTTHEFGHSFVNPHIDSMTSDVLRDTALFTPSLKKLLENSHIDSWKSCLIEHLVRLGEIRIARFMKDKSEEERLRKMHVNELGFILLPFLENEIEKYENNRKQFLTFASFLPNLFQSLHKLKPTDIDALVQKYTPLTK